MSARPASLVAGVGCLLAASCGGPALAPAGAVFNDGIAFDLGAEMPPDAFAPIATSDHYPAR